MRNFIQPGDVISLAAPYDVNPGDGLLVGATFGIATGKALSGAAVETRTEGVFDITAASAATGSAGALAYWDNTAKNVTGSSSGTTKIGVFLLAKTNGQTVARVRLNGSF